MSEWQSIETAPKDEMILGWADGMMRLLIWEGRWMQVGATIEAGWFEPTHWRTLPPTPDNPTIRDALREQIEGIEPLNIGYEYQDGFRDGKLAVLHLLNPEPK